MPFLLIRGILFLYTTSLLEYKLIIFITMLSLYFTVELLKKYLQTDKNIVSLFYRNSYYKQKESGLMRKFKRRFAGIVILMAAILSMSMVAYAASTSSSYTYPNGYKMNYQLYEAKVGGASGAGAITETENTARAFVSIFGYDSSGDATNSGSKTQDYYVYLAIAGNGAKSFKSYHSLLDSNNKPIGKSCTLTLN